MSYSLTWLPRVLENAGLKVATEFGWETRGRGEMGVVLGVMCHHTAGWGAGNMPSMRVLVNGRPDLPGPLSQLGLGRDGTYYVIAAGRCNHAGAGAWKGITRGNTHFIGIEAEHSGVASAQWPEAQLRAYVHGVAAILAHVRRGVDFCVGHKEWAPTRKRDPVFEMPAFRTRVAEVLNGAVLPLPLIPAAEPPAASGAPGRPTVRRGSRGRAVEEAQGLLGLTVTGEFGASMEATVRAFQSRRGLVPDGIIGPKTWLELSIADAAPPPPVAAAAQRLAWGARVSPEFRDRVRRIATDIGCGADALMACMAFETGERFTPDVRNRVSGATGLIQFMPSTAVALGTTTDRLAALSAEEQLEFVAKYFRWWPPVRTVEDVYMAILWPRAIGKPNDYVLFARPATAYEQNRGLDRDRDGRVTKAEAAAKVRAALEKGLLDRHSSE
jgi:hypothetical protein